MDIFGYYITLPQQILLANNPLATAWFFIKNGFWLVFLIIFYKGFKEMWINYGQGKYMSKWKWVLLAINVPKNNEQMPKAVESIFATLAGSHVNFNWVEKYWKCKKLEYYSFEIISVGGYVRFLIRTTVQFRDLVEAAVYAQYPTAEIIEVEDYVDKVPHHYPNDEYDLWGSEIVLYNKEAYPIRTYLDFEHMLSQEIKDPMAVMLETLSKLQPQEQVWLQFIVTPTNEKWRDGSVKLVKKLIGAKVEKEKSKIGKIFQEPTNLLMEARSQIMAGDPEAAAKQAKMDAQFGKMFSMSPGERRTVEQIEKKAGKLGFETKIRHIYVAPKAIFAKGRGVSAVMGAIKQFNTLDMNGFKPHPITKTVAHYFFTKYRVALRQRRIIRAYSNRSNWAGLGTGKILNIEELASIWHFPMLTVKAPLVKKIQSTRSEPPFTLPIGEMPTEAEYQKMVQPEIIEETMAPIASEPVARPTVTKKYQPPPNLPIGD